MTRKTDMVRVRVQHGKYVQDHFETSEGAPHWTGSTVYKEGDELEVTPEQLAALPGKFEVLSTKMEPEA